MKRIFKTYERVEDAISVVNELREKDGLNAYRLGLTVYIED
jgi:hypothetical protein